MPTYWDLVRPVLHDAWKAWDFRVAATATIAFAILTRFIDYTSRADLTRQMLTLGAPIGIALLAILVAGFTLFAMLANSEFRRTMGSGMPYVTGAFLYSISIAASSLMIDVFLFAFTFVPTLVDGPGFWLMGQIAFFGFIYTVTVVMQASYELTLIILGSK